MKITFIVVVVLIVIVVGAIIVFLNPRPVVSNKIDVSSMSPSSPQVAAQNFLHMVTLETSLGEIRFKTYDADAPNTVENFITLAKKGFYGGLIFHRVIDGFMIQGGDPTGTGSGGPGYQFADELHPATESYQAGYIVGTVAMANAGPNTNGSQFFITVANAALKHDYTIFGKVIFGQDVANAIAKVPTGAGDRPITPIVIKKVTVSESVQ